MDLSVVLVYYKTPGPLLQCLASLAPELMGSSAEVVVVDNDSRDGVTALLADRFPAVRVRVNPDNQGYAGGVNRGLLETRGEFVLIMNPDCEVRPGAVAALVRYLSTHPRTAIAGPKILNPDGSLEYSARSFPDHLTFLFNRYSLLHRLFPNNRHSQRYLLSDWDHACERDVDWLSGACLLVRRAAVDRVGPMDEAYFMFNEDVDWCRRMNLAGFSVTYVPDAVVVHHIGASRKRVASRVIVGRHLGMIHYFHKHHPTNPVFAVTADAFILMRAGLMLAQNAFKPR